MVGESVNEDEQPTIIEIFEQQCPYYMAMGMTAQEFWEGDPHLVVYYRKAHELKLEVLNDLEWRMGFYNYTAFNVVLANAFRKKGTKPIDYLEKPLPIREPTEAEKKAEQQRKTEAFIANLERKKHLREVMKEQKDARSD